MRGGGGGGPDGLDGVGVVCVGAEGIRQAQRPHERRGGRGKLAVKDRRHAREERGRIPWRMHGQAVFAHEGVQRSAQQAEAAGGVGLHARLAAVPAFADKLIELSDGFTGADLESTVRDLAYRTIANETFVLDTTNIISAFENVIPLSQTSPEKIEAIREWGKERAVPASGKPIGEETLNQRKSGPRTRTVLV